MKETPNEVVARTVRGLRFERGINSIDKFAELCKPWGLSRSTLFRIESNKYATVIEDDKISALARFFEVEPDVITETNEWVSIRIEASKRHLMNNSFKAALEAINELMGVLFEIETSTGGVVRKSGSSRERADVLLQRGNLDLQQGHPDAALIWYGHSLEVATTARDSEMVHRARHNIALAHLSLNEFQRVFEILENDNADREYENPQKKSKNAHLQMSVHMRLRNWKVAEQYALEALNMADPGDHAFRARLHQNIASLCRRQGNSDSALENLKSSMTHAEKSGDVIGHIYSLKTYGELFETKGELHLAKEAYMEANKLAVEAGLEKEILLTRFLSLAIADRSKSYKELNELITSLEKLSFAPSDMADLYKKMARSAKDMSFPEEANEFYEKYISKIEI